jgi:hypothetical protein
VQDLPACTHEALASGELRLSGHGTVVACLVCGHCQQALGVVGEFAYVPAPRSVAAPVGGWGGAPNDGA